MSIKNTDSKKRMFEFNSLSFVRKAFIGTERYALFLSLVLISIWSVGRVFEAYSRSTVFEPDLVYWLGLSIWMLLGLFVVGEAAKYTQNLTKYYKQYSLVITWLFFGLLSAVTLYLIQGYRVASLGLFSIMAGSTESAQQAFFLLFKFHPVTPILPVNLVAAKTMGVALEAETLMPFVWTLSYVFVFFVWSLVYGTFLLLLKGSRFSKVILLFLSISGAVIAMTFKTTVTPSKEQLIFLHAGAVVVLFLQVLLTYSSLRFSALKTNESSENDKSFPLPPATIKFALFLLIVLPILADLQNQFAVVLPTGQVIRELTVDQPTSGLSYITVAQISIHSGPALGDDIVGVLPKGTRVHALDNQHGWVRIGTNRWVLPKFLSLIEKE